MPTATACAGPFFLLLVGLLCHEAPGFRISHAPLRVPAGRQAASLLRSRARLAPRAPQAHPGSAPEDPREPKRPSSYAQRLKKQRAQKEAQLRKVRDYEAELQQGYDDAWSNATTRQGIDWLFERLRRNVVGRSKYPKTVDEVGGLPFFGKDGIPDHLGGIGFWTSRFVRLPPRSEYSDRGAPGSKPGGVDSFRILFNNLLQFMIGNESEDGAPVASWDPNEALRRVGFVKFWYFLLTGNLQELAGGPLFLLLNDYFHQEGPVFKLAFGPRSFIVISDPVAARHVMTAAKMYDKGMLAEILEPIMGQGLIPANPEVWKQRRRVIVPGFHRRWLNRMITLFAKCNSGLIASLYEAANDEAGGRSHSIDMEEKFCSVGLDIIGSAVFNYDFDSATTESPVVKAVYRCLREAEHRSTAILPYWTIPGLAGRNSILEGQRVFHRDLELLNRKLDECIQRALETKREASVEDLERRDYEGDDDDASLLRFLVDMKGEEVSDKQLRDDLMTMLVAGHETTAALLTWTLYELVRSSGQGQEQEGHMEGESFLERCRAEIDRVLGDRAVPTYEDVQQLSFTRLCLIESLRLYPEPPVLIRRALDDDVLPEGGTGFSARLPRGADIFISTWNLHRSPDLWEEPLRYNPDRWAKPFQNPDVQGWKGFRPEAVNGLYPDEQATDFAFLPFGGGKRKCVGDQFAMLEATVTLSLLLRRFDFSFVGEPQDVGLRTGATIHTQNGLWMKVKARRGVQRSGGVWVEPKHPVLNPGGGRLKREMEMGRLPGTTGTTTRAGTVAGTEVAAEAAVAGCPFHDSHAGVGPMSVAGEVGVAVDATTSTATTMSPQADLPQKQNQKQPQPQHEKKAEPETLSV